MPVPWDLTHTVSLILLGVTGVTVGCGGLGSGDEDTRVAAGGYATQPAQVYVDGEGEDWDSLSVRHVDADGEEARVDLRRLSLAHSQEHLFFRIELDEAVHLQEDSGLTLYLDVDNDPDTGTKTLGLGADVVWNFAEQSGHVEMEGTGREVGHADIGLTPLPTVRSDVFEIALDRSARPLDSTVLFRGDSLRVALTSRGDRLPNEDGGLGYVLGSTNVELEAPSLSSPTAGAVRLVSYNVERDALFEADVQPSYGRILEAVSADVMAFQEVYDHSADETKAVVEEELGLVNDWHWEKKGFDLIIGSRFPIDGVHAIPNTDEGFRSGAFLLDTEAPLGRPLMVITMHLPCCNDPGRNAHRQRLVDQVIAFIRKVKNGDGPFPIAENTPIVILGDMNFVGDAQQPRTLQTGEIVNTEEFGSPLAPDWDGTDLMDTNPRQTASPMHTTWIDAGSPFAPGRLDYAFLTDSVLKVEQAFVLRTATLSADQRTTYRLQSGDTDAASDHLPVILDLTTR